MERKRDEEITSITAQLYIYSISRIISEKIPIRDFVNLYFFLPGVNIFAYILTYY